jgi:hypothetical protein
MKKILLTILLLIFVLPMMLIGLFAVIDVLTSIWGKGTRLVAGTMDWFQNLFKLG